MFYSPDILSRRSSSSFGIYWLAATLTSSSRSLASSTRLTRKQILSCDLVTACENLAEPKEPFALRLSSNLMCGIVRVYAQKFGIWAGDVAVLSGGLKKGLFSDLGKDKSKEIDLPVIPLANTSTAITVGNGNGGITLKEDKWLALAGWDVDWESAFDFRTFSSDPAGEAEVELEGDEEDFITEYDPSNGVSAHQVRDKASINLVEPHLVNWKHSNLASSYDGGFGFEGFGQPLPLGEGFEGEGLLQGIDPELDADLAAAEAYSNTHQKSFGSRGGSKAGSGRSGRFGLDMGGPASSSAGGGAREGWFGEGQEIGLGALESQGEGEGMGGYDWDPFAGMNFGGGNEAVGGEGVDLGLDAPNIGLEAQNEADRHSASSEERRKRDLDDGDQAELERNAENEADQASKPKPKKAKKVHFDSNPSLSDTQMHNIRHSYADRMFLERERQEKEKEEKRGKERALEIIFGVPEGVVAPQLVNLWKNNVVQVPFGGGRSAEDKKIRTLKSILKKRSPLAAANPNLQGPAGHPHQDIEAGLGQVADPQNLEQDFPIFWDDNQGDQDPEAEAARAYTGGEGAYMGGMDDLAYLDQDLDVEVARGRAGSAGGLTGSQRQSLLPWNLGLGTSDGGGDIGGFGSSQHGAFRVSLDTPLQRGRKRSRTGSLVPSHLGSAAGIGLGVAGGETPQRAGSAGLDLDLGAGVEGFAIEESDRASSVQDVALVIATLERESLNFLSYTKQLARQQQSQFQSAQFQSLLFSDLCPVASTNETVAAQALYHVLALTSKGLLKVQQEVAYSDIHIEIVA